MDLSDLSIADLVALKIDAERTIEEYEKKYRSVVESFDFGYIAFEVWSGDFKYEHTNKSEYYFAESKEGLTVYLNNIQKAISNLTEDEFELDMERYLEETEIYFRVINVLSEKRELILYGKDRSEESNIKVTSQSKCYSRYWELKRTIEHGGKDKTAIVNIMLEEKEFEGNNFDNIYKSIYRETKRLRKSKLDK